MNSYSMSGQDRWVLERLNKKNWGTFLEVGAGHPIHESNTFLLENLFGWSGFSIDHDFSLYSEWCQTNRRLCIADALEFEWLGIVPHLNFDYLSLDIDEDQLAFVEKFPWDRMRFAVMTVEHDAYRFGDKTRDRIREILSFHGYRIHTQDVSIDGTPYEDWWECQ